MTAWRGPPSGSTVAMVANRFAVEEGAHVLGKGRAGRGRRAMVRVGVAMTPLVRGTRGFVPGRRRARCGQSAGADAVERRACPGLARARLAAARATRLAARSRSFSMLRGTAGSVAGRPSR